MTTDEKINEKLSRIRRVLEYPPLVNMPRSYNRTRQQQAITKALLKLL